MSEKRIFETDDKFWEVWIDGSQVFTHFGKTGASGQTKLKETADAAAAGAAARRGRAHPAPAGLPAR